MSTVKTILSITAGVVTGVIIGILFAPHKGSRTRRNIARKSGEISEEIMNKVHNFGDFINEKLDGTRGVYKYLIHLGKSKA